jgi:hypothetical protein
MQNTLNLQSLILILIESKKFCSQSESQKINFHSLGLMKLFSHAVCNLNKAHLSKCKVRV